MFYNWLVDHRPPGEKKWIKNHMSVKAKTRKDAQELIEPFYEDSDEIKIRREKIKSNEGKPTPESNQSKA